MHLDDEFYRFLDELPELPEEQFDELAGHYFRTANPNPERLGCPPRPVLEKVAHRSEDVPSEVFDHLTECSPCTVAIEEIRDQCVRKLVNGIGTGPEA